MKHLFVSDLDGTLLNPESRISARTASIVTELSRRGVLFTVATARTPATVEPLLSATLTLPPAIVMTGAAMWDRRRQSYINPHFMEPATAACITEACAAHGIRPFSYTLDGSGIIRTYYNGRTSRREQKFIDERAHLPLKRFEINPTGDAAMSYPDTVLIFALGLPDSIYPLADELRATGLCSVSSYPDIFNSDVAFLEVFAPGVSKASAVTDLKKLTGADRLTVFGDNLNDLPMMAVADVAVAVGNAFPEVKAAADIVIGSNRDDAVALYISEELTQHIE
ncbi:MAG: HAD family hydrolase [Paramuribaculum sp.]